VRIELSDIDPAVFERLADILEARLRLGHPESRWLYGAAAAAEFLNWPRERVYNRLSELPHARDGARLLFNTAELNRWLEERGR
jgi:hypothetical protein